MPATLSILTNVFRDPRERGRAIAVWAGFSGLAVALGPVTGGILLRHFEWSSVFWVNLPLGAVALVAGYFLVPTSPRPEPGQARPARCGPVDHRPGIAAVRHHRGAGEGVDRPARRRRLRRGHHRAGVVHHLGAADADADARHAVLPEPSLHGGQQRDHPDVLRHVRVDVPDDPVLAVRPRLQPARCGPADDPLRGDDDGRRSTVGPDRRAPRHQAGRHDGAADHVHGPGGAVVHRGDHARTRS